MGPKNCDTKSAGKPVPFKSSSVAKPMSPPFGTLWASSLLARGIHRNHRQRYTAGVDELRFVRIVVILDFAITDADLARIFILQRIDRQVFLPLFTQGFGGQALLFELPIKLFLSRAGLLLPLVNCRGNLL